MAVRGVVKRFGDAAGGITALEDIELTVASGDFLCVIGPSGCGKTTLLNILAGFEAPTTGEASMRGRPITRPGAERGVVFQQGSLFTWMNVVENVAFGPRCKGLAARDARAVAQEYIELVGLGGFEARYPYELSGGMQQRVGIARVLANDPEILLMDDPFAALDAQTRELLQEEVKRIWRRTRKTVFWITHSIEEALFLATRVVVMTARPGRIKASFEYRFHEADDFRITTSPEFAAAKRDILELLRAETVAADRQEALHG